MLFCKKSVESINTFCIYLCTMYQTNLLCTLCIHFWWPSITNNIKKCSFYYKTILNRKTYLWMFSSSLSFNYDNIGVTFLYSLSIYNRYLYVCYIILYLCFDHKHGFDSCICIYSIFITVCNIEQVNLLYLCYLIYCFD